MVQIGKELRTEAMFIIIMISVATVQLYQQLCCQFLYILPTGESCSYQTSDVSFMPLPAGYQGGSYSPSAPVTFYNHAIQVVFERMDITFSLYCTPLMNYSVTALVCTNCS